MTSVDLAGVEVGLTLPNCRAPRSAVLSFAQSRSFVTIPNDGRACRPESLLTPERLRS